MSDQKVDARARLRHDLRTPLHQIIGYAELLEDEVRDAGQEKFVADLEKIRDAARKALEAVDEAVPSMPSPAVPTVFREPETEAATLAAALDPERSTSLAPAPDPYLGPPGPGAVRLLVVDDNELNRDMLSRRLGSRGFAVEVAEDGERALALIERSGLRPRAAGRDDARPLRHRRAPACARALARVGPARDHGHRARQLRGRGGGARPRSERLRDEAARLPGGAGAGRVAAHPEAAEAGDPPPRRGPRAAQPLHPVALRPLPERRGRGRAPRVARGAAARRRAAEGHAADVRPAGVHAPHRGTRPRAGPASPELLPRGDGGRDPVPPGHDRRVRGGRHTRDLRRPPGRDPTTPAGPWPARSRCRRPSRS